MPKKKEGEENSQDLDWDITQELGEEKVEEPVYSPEFLEEHTKIIKKKQLLLREIRRISDGRILVEGDDDNFYLLPKDTVFEAKRSTLLVEDDSRLEKLYNWEKEIEASLPGRNALVKQIRKSFYLSGAFARGDLKKNEVARNLTRYAFPYTFEEIEE